MKTTTIEKVPKGDYFKLDETSKTVYVHDGYNRSTKKYSFHRFDNINAFREKKKGTAVIIGFEF